MNFSLDTFTIVACGVIFAAFVAAWIYIIWTPDAKLQKRKRWIDQLPSLISTLGVIGTFLGITKGLLAFDTEGLDQSIPVLLEGLKTAFFTSLLGMTGSLILNRVVITKSDKEVKHSESEKAATMIIDAIKSNNDMLSHSIDNAVRQLVTVIQQNGSIDNIKGDIVQIKDDLEEFKGIGEEVRSEFGNIVTSSKNLLTVAEKIRDELSRLKAVTEEIQYEFPRLRAVAVTATASISAIDNNIEDLKDSLDSIIKYIEEIKIKDL